MNLPGPLFAAGADLLRILIVVLFIAVPVILNLVAKWNEAQKAAAKRAQVRGPGRPGPVQAGGAPAGGRKPDALKDEVAEFLRRAAQGRAGARGAAPPAPRPRPPIQIEVVEEEELGAGVGRHVERYLDVKQIDEHARRLGADVDQSDERLEKHLHKTFDHRLSRLGRLSDEPTEPESELAPEPSSAMPSAAAAGFAALLSDATSIRQAIILNEILRRPEDRWG